MLFATLRHIPKAWDEEEYDGWRRRSKKGMEGKRLAKKEMEWREDEGQHWGIEEKGGEGKRSGKNNLTAIMLASRSY